MRYDEANPALAGVISKWLQGKPAPRVLEAGGGSISNVSLPKASEITVIDISKEQLERNTYAQHKILGDLHDYPLSPSSYDMVVCWDVMEHLEEPQKVAESLLRATRPGGIVLIAAPHRRSLRGMITRLSPHWFHVFVHRRVFGSKTAGLPGYPPFPTFMDKAMAPDRLLASGRRLGFEVMHYGAYESILAQILREQHPMLAQALDAIAALGRLLSGGRWHPEHSDFHLVLMRKAASGVQQAAPPLAADLAR
jgi:SAM-dependent methyltransferase